MGISDRLIDLAERGWVPDFLLRLGIRRLCRKRLQDVDLGDCEQNQLQLERLIEQFSIGPIAPLPEKANEQHYEVPAGFYDLVLGKRKKYSCCLYANGSENLDQAEEASLAETCRRAEISDGQNILELGCGWGSLTLWIAEKYPNTKITAVSNSRSQREFILGQAESRGLDGNLTVITCDMNDFDTKETFDRVVSIEMFEHMRNYRRLLKNIARWLAPKGKLFVHIFCHRQFTYEFQDLGANDWMSRYFFSGGVMPSDGLFLRFADHMQMTRQWRWGGMNYSRTSEHWLANLDRQKSKIMPILVQTYGPTEAVRWFNRWRMFFLAVSELFATDSGQQWWVSHYLFERHTALKIVSELSQTKLEPGRLICTFKVC